MAATQQVRVQVLLHTEEGGREYNDALYFTPEEFDALKDGDIEAMRRTRFEAWVESVKNPPKQQEPTKEELESHRAYLASQVAETDAKIAQK